MSATPSVLRTSLRAVSSRRHVSSSTSAPRKTLPSYPTLPPEKMRALVSLYHQADKFITPENLSERIDAAFFDRPTVSSSSPEEPFWRLDARLKERREKPKIGQADISAAMPTAMREYERDRMWSDMRTQREVKVLGALFGVEAVGKPGLEALEDEGPRIQAHHKRDLETQS